VSTFARWGTGSILFVLAFTGTVPAESPSFVHDVEPIFTRLGCNMGSCHGKGAGQNGFRLSLRGYAPEMDYVSLTREMHTRRIDSASPENSLLLLKPLGKAPHEGGKLFSESSREYQVLLDWIKAGTPAPLKDEPGVTRVWCEPAQGARKPGQSVQLTIFAEYADGRKRDVTWLARFDSNDAGIAPVDPLGKISVHRHGETAVRASFMGRVAVAIVTVPYEQKVDPNAFVARNNFVDDHVLAKLKALNLEPSGLSDDAEFVRRVYLDTIGTLPTPDEVRTFLADTDSKKRSRLIDDLLNRPEFVDYWALYFGDLLQNRKERDHDVRGTKGVRSFHEWIRKQIAEDRPWDQMAREVLTAKGNSEANPAVGYYIVTVGEHSESYKSEIVASVAQSFLGTRIGCAQCHNHPLEKYTQDDYYHFAAFFSRVRLERKDPKQGTTLTVGLRDQNQNKNPVGVSQPRTGQFMKPQPLDRSAVPVAVTDDPREKLAAWITDPKNEAFSGAMVNRIVRHYLGIGLVEPVDDLRASNPPTNPEMWAALNKEFVSHKYDLRHLMRVILNSRTYQLTSATKPTNATDTRFYSHYSARRLPAEVLADALSQTTGVPDTFPGYPVGLRAIQLPDPTLKSYFLTIFGRSERVTACACERVGDVTMPQLLHLQNGEAVVQKIRSGDGRLSKWLGDKKTDAQIIDELFLTTLSRLPTASERTAVTKALGDGSPRDEVFRDLFWALLNAKEFTFNH
jgi:Protein of unknown function (DUF1549)/Protein of unknown function (DUF1553)